MDSDKHLSSELVILSIRKEVPNSAEDDREIYRGTRLDLMTGVVRDEIRCWRVLLTYRWLIFITTSMESPNTDEVINLRCSYRSRLTQASNLVFRQRSILLLHCMKDFVTYPS